MQQGQQVQPDPLVPMALRDQQVLLGQQVKQEQLGQRGLRDRQEQLGQVDHRVHLDQVDLAVRQVLQLSTLGARRCPVERLLSLETMTTPPLCPTQ